MVVKHAVILSIFTTAAAAAIRAVHHLKYDVSMGIICLWLESNSQGGL